MKTLLSITKKSLRNIAMPTMTLKDKKIDKDMEDLKEALDKSSTKMEISKADAKAVPSRKIR